MNRNASASFGIFGRMRELFEPRFKQPFERDALFILAFGCFLYLLSALLTFQPMEPWLYSYSSSPVLTSKNLAGPLGNKIAGGLVFYWGLVSLILPCVLLQFAWEFRQDRLKQNIIPVLFGWLTLLLSVLPILSSIHNFIDIRGISFATGGVFGDTIARNLKHSTGVVGTQIILWSTFIASMILIFRLGFSDALNGLRLVSEKRKSKESKPTATNPKAQTEYLARESEILSSPTLASPSVENQPPEFDLNPTLSFEEVSTKVLNTRPPENVLQNQEISSIFEENPLELYKPTPTYVAPTTDIFLKAQENFHNHLQQRELESTAAHLTSTLAEFGVLGKIIGWQPGPVVTVYEFQPEAGVKQAKILSLMDDLALSLKVDSIFINPVPGKRALGIQVPNAKRDMVYLGDIIASDSFQKNASPLTFAMGKTINGTPYTTDLTSMPHLLAAGATGTGKSVGINSLLCSIIMKSAPEDVRMILVDPKMLELSVYEGIPHLLMPVITEPDRASSALKWAANEMERRYKIMQYAQVRNIAGFNNFWEAASAAQKGQIKSLMNDEHIDQLPYILLVIDELADLMLTAPKDVESSIQRLAQKARASGIHMVLATQRPSVDVITGVIKANLPCRLSFQVVSRHDSKTILDATGAEKLLGKGDFLLQRPGVGRLERIQGAFVSDEEVLALVAESKKNYEVCYDEKAMEWIDSEVIKTSATDDLIDSSNPATNDAKWDEAINIARTHGVVSASFLQRHLQIGYNRAARIVEAMEAKSLVAKAEGSKPRKWLGN